MRRERRREREREYASFVLTSPLFLLEKGIKLKLNKVYKDKEKKKRKRKISKKQQTEYISENLEQIIKKLNL